LGRTGFAIALLAGLFTVSVATPASAQAASVEVSPSSVAAGGTVQISGTLSGDAAASCSEGVTLTSDAALFPPDGFGPQVSVAANGRFETDYTVPESTTAASYSIGLRCGGGNLGVSASLEVTGAGSATTASNTTAPTAVTSTGAAGTTTPATASATSTTTTDSGDGGGDNTPWIIVGVIAVLAVLAVGAALTWRRRSKPPA